MNNKIDERALLRFASGEMSEEEETTFIAANEMAGDARWREAVLAIIEHRRIVSSLTEFAAEPSTTLAISRLPISITPNHNHQKTKRWFTPMAALTSLAAGLLVGLAAGHFREPPREVEQGSGASVANANPHPTQVAQAEAPPHTNASPQSMQDAGAFGLEPIIREDQVISLRQQGFQVEEQPTIYLIDGGNGRKWPVPTEKATVHYISR